MSSITLDTPLPTSSTRWLKIYYATRAAFSVAWVGLAVTLGASAPLWAAILLVAYPAWDALANAVDAQRAGGLGRNRSQALNLVVSALAAIGIAVALGSSMSAVIGVFGIWAALAGILQLVTGLRRWKSYGAQWAMILSGAQSTLAGIFFINLASSAGMPGITDVAPYAGFGAFYFLVSAIWLTVADARPDSSSR